METHPLTHPLTHEPAHPEDSAAENPTTGGPAAASPTGASAPEGEFADPLARFSPETRAWFEGSFSAPTPAQAQAWRHVSAGRDTLVVAPTGSGKTLSAFLWALDRLLTTSRPAEVRHRCRVLYVSPLKALAVDVERNLRSPLVGIGHAAARLGRNVTDVRVGIRSGDTPAGDRRAFASRPPDILITTPESLFLLLTSAARESLRGVEAVIVDEIHAVAGTKRGAHLAVSLARLDALLPARAQRIGLSATVRPVDEVARFLTGGLPAAVVAPPSEKSWDLRVVVPVPDLADLGEALTEPAAAGEVTRGASIWPHVEERLVDLVTAHRSTLVFANSRRLAERLTARLNEEWDRRLGLDPDGQGPPGDELPRPPDEVAGPRRPPAEVAGQSGLTHAPPAVLARAHHGSVSKEARADIEAALKSGRLPAVVATSSLELGIDMGAVDLVVQVESPPSVASGLQRVGRAGHQVGATSRGVFFPKFRGDLVQSAVVVERMRAGAIEATRVPSNPLDVLAQQVVAMCALDDWRVDDILGLLRRSAPFSALSRPVLEAVLEMLAGRYPSEEFAELRPRLVWDRVEDVLRGRPGAQRLAVTSGGTIPDRGLYGVFLVGDGPGRRVGELDEEMVYESRVGDVFTLGTSSWRIEDITHDQVLVTPAPGVPGRLPFWKGDTLGRPAELGRAVGAFVRELETLAPEAARARLGHAGLDAWAADNLLAYLAQQRTATGVVPDDRTLVVERFRDELGDWRIVVHSPFGGHVHAPWALLVAARMRERFGVDAQAMAADDGIVLRLPDIEPGEGSPLDADIAAALVPDPEEVRDLVTAELGGSALFAARFRECASRALLLPRRDPGRRQALWQQRQRGAQLLSVASRYPSFPVVLEAVRECVQDVFDVPGLIDLLREVQARSVHVVDVETPAPSPFARSLLFGYVAQHLYDGDSPLAERRAAALSLDPELLADLLGADASSLRDLLDPGVVRRTEEELQQLVPERAARHAEDVADLVRRLGPLPASAVAARAVSGADVEAWLTGLEAERRLIRVRIAGTSCWAVTEDAGRLRDGLGVAVPPGVASSLLEPTPDPLGDLATRYALAHGPFTAAELAGHLGLGRAVAADVLRRLTTAGRLVAGELRPAGVQPSGTGAPPPDPGPDYCDPAVMRTLRRRSLAALRAEVEPATARDLARFLPAWQHVGPGLRGVDGVARAVEQLAGLPLPISAWETLVLPARVAGYAPHLLDELTTAGEVLWQGHGPIPGGDGWVSLHLADTAPLTLRAPADLDLDEIHQALVATLEGGGAFHTGGLVARLQISEEEVTRALWELVWSGRVGNDGFAPLRALIGARGAHRRRGTPRRARRPARGTGSRAAPPVGRWFLLPEREPDPTVGAHARAETLLDRYGVLTRGAVTAEDIPGGFAATYRVLAAAEEAGRVRRGYFVEGLGAAQFGSAGAVDRLRAMARPLQAGTASAPGDPGPSPPEDVLVLAATDPANAYGAALPWPPAPRGDGAHSDGAHSDTGHRPGRRPGSLVVLDAGDLVIYLERGGRTARTWTSDATILARCAAALARLVVSGPLPGLTIGTADGVPLLGSEHPLAAALAEAGFHLTPRGWRRR